MTTQPTPSALPDDEGALLEVTVLHPRDAEAAAAGGADRVLLIADPQWGGRTPEPSQVSAVVRESGLPVRVLLRRTESFEVGAEEFRALVELGRRFLELGASGFAFGFLDRDLEIDRASCAELATELGTMPGEVRDGSAGVVPWTFHRGFDSALEVDRAWRDVLDLPGLDAVASAGSTRGFAVGGEELIARARADERVAPLVLAAGGLTPEEVPWLMRAGVRQYAVAEEVRPDHSWDKAYVDADYVRSWRLLLDDALYRALGIPLG